MLLLGRRCAVATDLCVERFRSLRAVRSRHRPLRRALPRPPASLPRPRRALSTTHSRAPPPSLQEEGSGASTLASCSSANLHFFPAPALHPNIALQHQPWIAPSTRRTARRAPRLGCKRWRALGNCSSPSQSRNSNRGASVNLRSDQRLSAPQRSRRKNSSVVQLGCCSRAGSAAEMAAVQ
jgi:hypothetical protein